MFSLTVDLGFRVLRSAKSINYSSSLLSVSKMLLLTSPLPLFLLLSTFFMVFLHDHDIIMLIIEHSQDSIPHESKHTPPQKEAVT